MQNHMVAKHQDLNHFQFDDTVVEADLNFSESKMVIL